jgi:hypothetical protein
MHWMVFVSICWLRCLHFLQIVLLESVRGGTVYICGLFSFPPRVVADATGVALERPRNPQWLFRSQSVDFLSLSAGSGSMHSMIRVILEDMVILAHCQRCDKIFIFVGTQKQINLKPQTFRFFTIFFCVF